MSCTLYKIIKFFFITIPFPGHNFLYSTYIYFILAHLFHQFTHCSYSVQCAYIPICYPHLINPFPLPKSIPLCLTVLRPQFRLPNSFFFFSWQVIPVTQPLTWRASPPYLYPRAWWPSYTTRHRVPNLVSFCDLHGLQWDYSLPQSYFILCMVNSFPSLSYNRSIALPKRTAMVKM